MLIQLTRRSNTGGYLTPYIPVNPIDGLKENKIIIRRNDENKILAYGYSSELKFTGADAVELKTWLVNDANSFNNWYDVVLTDECCGREYPMVLKSNNIDWCENNCEITAQLTEQTEDTLIYNCLKSKMIWDDQYGFKSQQHPRIVYCIELRPRFLHHLILNFGILLIIILRIFTIVIAVITAIIFVVCGILDTIRMLVNTINAILAWFHWGSIGGGPSCPASLQDGGFLTMYNQLIVRIENSIIGCGKKHPSPTVRSYISNVCRICNVAWESSILKNPANDYFNMVYFSAQVKEGLDDDTSQYWQDDNRPILTGAGLLDQLKQVFNADWKIINGKLYFERKDWFLNTTPWLDTRTLTENSIISQCYKWKSLERPAYGNFEYSKDAVDWVGNEACERYRDLVEWNNPPSAIQKGALDIMLPFSPAGFRNDGILPDLLSFYESDPFLGNLISGYRHALLLNEGKCSNPKLLIWDGQSVSNAYCKYNFGNHLTNHSGVNSSENAGNSTEPATNRIYNYPLWFALDYSNPLHPNLYDGFWYIENPRLTPIRGFEYELKIIFNCDNVNNATVDAPIIIVVDGTATTVPVDEIEIDYETNIMTLKGEF